MTKIVILGSCRFEPYEVIAKPEKVEGKWNTEEGYQKATEKFYPAMQESDLILVYAPDGIGEHTKRDIDYANSIGKKVHVLIPLDTIETFEILQDKELMQSLHESLNDARERRTIIYKPLEEEINKNESTD